VFFSDADRDLLREACAREGVATWSYCLAPNHAHLILTPKMPEAARPRARQGALFLGRDGQGTPAGGGALWRDESGQGAAGRRLRAAETIGRPLGSPAFFDRLAALPGREPRPGKRSRKPRFAMQAAG